MKTALAFTAAGFLVFTGAAFAQNAGQPGATGTGNGLSGSNTGSGPATSNFDAGKGVNNQGGTSSNSMSEGRAASARNMTNDQNGTMK